MYQATQPHHNFQVGQHGYWLDVESGELVDGEIVSVTELQDKIIISVRHNGDDGHYYRSVAVRNNYIQGD